MRLYWSSDRIVYSDLDVKSWFDHPPTVGAVRPGTCPCCDAPGAPLGGRLGLHGHGTRGRLVRGPLSPDGRPEEVEVLARRYRCQRCGAVLLVLPRGVLRSRFYSAAAIGLALMLWAVHHLPAREVRRLVSPWRVVGSTAAAGWASLRRWVRQAPRLFPGIRRCPDDWTYRQKAERIALALAACAPASDGALIERVFAGAAQAA